MMIFDTNESSLLLVKKTLFLVLNKCKIHKDQSILNLRQQINNYISIKANRKQFFRQRIHYLVQPFVGKFSSFLLATNVHRASPRNLRPTTKTS